ncbi:MAG: hypothetical protein AAGE01_24145 [Pseudomonadota bacterium]
MSSRLVLLWTAVLLGGCATRGLDRDDRARLEQTRQATLELRQTLETYYDGPTVLDDTWYLPPDHAGRRAGIERQAENLARTWLWREAFVIGAIGSSVIAGHDSCLADNYPSQLERTLAPVWEAAEIAFSVRNAAQGGACGDSYQNQVWCLATLVGDDLDVTHYEWTYFENRDPNMFAFHEMFYRNSLLHSGAAAHQLLYTGDCDGLHARDQALLERYAPFGADVLCMSRGITRAGYPGKAWGVVGDTLHDTTREGEAPDVTPERRDSLGVVFRNWHPGPLLFQTTADALAWRYTEALLLALEWIEREPAPFERWPAFTDALTSADLPKLTECPASWCGGDDLPVCANFETPTFGRNSIALLAAIEKPVPGDKIGAWTFTATPEQRPLPEGEADWPHCTHPQACSGWSAPRGVAPEPLRFEVPALSQGLLLACCGRKHCGADFEQAGATFTLDGEASQARASTFAQKCIEIDVPASKLGKAFELGIEIPARDHPLPPVTHVIGR